LGAGQQLQRTVPVAVAAAVAVLQWLALGD
jgi:hypothetical protein